MTLKTKAQLSTELTTSYNDNTSGDISPGDIRAQQQNIIDSMIGLNESAVQNTAGPLKVMDVQVGIVYDAMVTMIANATNTVITVAGTGVKVAGTFVVQSESYFTCTTTGKCTYTGTEAIRLPVHAMVDMNPVSGSNIKLAMWIALNGTVIAESVSRVVVSASAVHCLQTFYQVDLVTNDYLEIYVANIDNTDDILVVDARLMIN